MRVRDRQDSFCPPRQARLTCWGQQHTAGGATYHDGARGRTGNPATVAGNSFVCRAMFPEDGRGWMCGDRRGRQAGIWGRRPAESLWVRVGGRMPPGGLVRGKWPPGGRQERDGEPPGAELPGGSGCPQ